MSQGALLDHRKFGLIFQVPGYWGSSYPIGFLLSDSLGLFFPIIAITYAFTISWKIRRPARRRIISPKRVLERGFWMALFVNCIRMNELGDDHLRDRPDRIGGQHRWRLGQSRPAAPILAPRLYRESAGPAMRGTERPLRNSLVSLVFGFVGAVRFTPHKRSQDCFGARQMYS